MAAQLALTIIGCLVLISSLAAAALLSALIVVLSHAVFWADYFLLAKLGLRLKRHFLSYIKNIGMFGESASRMGMSLRLFSLLLLGDLALFFAGFFWFYESFGQPRLSSEALWFGLALTAGALATAKAVPLHEAVQWGNVLFLEEVALIRSLWKSPSAPTGAKAADFIANEDYALQSPNAPLLRLTSGFTGDRLFELSIKPGQRPHVVLLFMESFRAANVGVIGRDVNASPVFDRLSRQGVLFRDFYCNGIQTARAVISSLFGVLPRFTEAPAQSDLRHCPRLVGLPHLFDEMGYLNAYLHNGYLKFERQDLFFPRNRYHQVLGCEDIQKRFPEAQDFGGWGVPDEYLMRCFADWLDDQERKNVPTFSTLFTITNHYPYWIPEGFSVPAFDFPDNPEKTSFLETFYYSDYCLGLLVKLLQEKGLEEKTILFILADTGQPLGEHDNFSEQQYLFQENIHIPLLILAPAFLKEPAVIDDPGSQVDLLPTIMDLIGRPFRQHSMGSSLMRKNSGRKVFFNNPYGTRTVGVRTGPYKVLYEFATRQTFLFDLSRDPHELHNIANDHPELAAELRQKLIDTTSFVQELYDQDRFC